MFRQKKSVLTARPARGAVGQDRHVGPPLVGSPPGRVDAQQAQHACHEHVADPSIGQDGLEARVGERVDADPNRDVDHAAAERDRLVAAPAVPALNSPDAVIEFRMPMGCASARMAATS